MLPSSVGWGGLVCASSEQCDYFPPEKSMPLTPSLNSDCGPFSSDDSIPWIFHLLRGWKLTAQTSACVEVCISQRRGRSQAVAPPPPTSHLSNYWRCSGRKCSSLLQRATRAQTGRVNWGGGTSARVLKPLTP